VSRFCGINLLLRRPRCVFLTAPPLRTPNPHLNPNPNPDPPSQHSTQAVFKHDLGDAPFRLTVPEFSVQPGQLVAVVGRVGAGKSSLLQAIMGNMELVRGGAGVWFDGGLERLSGVGAVLCGGGQVGFKDLELRARGWECIWAALCSLHRSLARSPLLNN